MPATFDRSQPAPPFDREQIAWTLGGPFKRDKAWWFTAFEFRNQDSVSEVGQRDLANRQIISTSAPAPLNDLLLSSKGDWQVNAQHNLSFRYALQDEDDTAPGSLRRPLGTAANMQISTNNYQSFVSDWTSTISPTVVNDFTFAEINFINRIVGAGTGNELNFPSVQDGLNFRVPQRTRMNRLQFRDNLSIQRGKHSLKFGGELQRIDADAIFDLFGSGSVFLSEDFATQDRNGDGQINDLDIPIDLVIRSAAPSRPPTVNNLDNTYFAWYVQDDIRLRPNFTLNIGLRYEFDTQTIDTGFMNTIPEVRDQFGQGTADSDKNNFAPRIGFNWDPWSDGKTSIHGGYGIYYDRIVVEVPLLEELLDGRTLPLEVRTGSALDANGNFVPGTPTLADPVAGDIIPGGIAIGINVIDPSISTPYVQQYNFGIEREIARDLVVSVDGVYSFGRHFIIGRPIGSVFNPNIDGPDSIVNIESSVGTTYSGLLVNVKKRFSHHFAFNAAYTLSKALNFSNDDQIPFLDFQLDPSNLRLDYGPAANDQRHRFVFSGVFDLPFDFQISPIWTMASDVPFDILLPDRSSRIPVIQRNAGGRLFRTGAELNALIQQINANGGINGETLPMVRSDLNLGDSFNSLDVRVSKFINFSDQARLELIAEFFNLFNVTNILGFNLVNFSGFQNALVRDADNPDFSSQFGAPLRTAGGVFGSGGPRAVQFAIRFNF